MQTESQGNLKLKAQRRVIWIQKIEEAWKSGQCCIEFQDKIPKIQQPKVEQARFQLEMAWVRYQGRDRKSFAEHFI